jgi:tetratricopeptide (TPR) repeat protein
MNLAFVSIARHAPAPPRGEAIEAIYATAHWLLGRNRVPEAAMVLRTLLQLAPSDERAWLGLGACHERIEQPLIALELYGAGSVVTRGTGPLSVRCQLARSRVLRDLGRDDEASEALDLAVAVAEASNDDALIALASHERETTRSPS